MQHRHSKNWLDARQSFIDMSEPHPDRIRCGVCGRSAPDDEKYFPFTSLKTFDRRGAGKARVCANCWKNECNRDPETAERLLELHDPPPAA